MDSPSSTAVDMRAQHRMPTVVNNNPTMPAGSARVSAITG